MITNHSCGQISQFLGICGFLAAVSTYKTLSASTLSGEVRGVALVALEIDALVLTVLSISACLTGSRLMKNKEA